MRKSTPILLFALFLVALASQAATASTGARRLPAALSASHAAAGSMVALVDNETDRDRDGLQGPVRRVRTETSKLVTKGGKMTEGARVVLETATYDMKGAKIDTAYFLGTGGSLTGKEVYKYDDRGNIVEMTLFNTDGSVLSKEKYEYEFDAMGNWTRMTTSVAVIENGQMSFEPTEVTYRIIAYYLEDTTAKKLQTAALAGNTNAAANVTPTALTGSKPADSKLADNKTTAPAVTVKSDSPVSQPKLTAAPANSNAAATNSNVATNNASAPAVKRATNNAPTALPKSSGATSGSPALVVPDGAALAASTNTGAPTVKTNDDLPPPPVKTAAKASLRPVSGGILNGKAVEMPKPLYPETARRSKVTGVVTVEVVIDVSGKVIGARAVSGPDMLRDAAERAARQAKFTPALLSGQPVRVSGLINYNFSL